MKNSVNRMSNNSIVSGKSYWQHAVVAVILSAVISLALFFSVGCSVSRADSRLAVFAAAGAKAAIDEVCQKFQAQTDVCMEISYGGGGEMLSKLILAGSGDIYIAPEQRFMVTATQKQAINPSTIKTIAYMIPVIAVRKGNPQHIVSLADLARPGIRVAITRPETTLLGKYAPEIFQKAGIAEDINKNILTYAADPNNLMTMLLMGSIDAGITWHFYGTSASDKIEVVYFTPEQLTGVGEMQMAVTAYCADMKAAPNFIRYVVSDDGKAVFKKYGYIVDAQEVKKYWK